MLPRDDIAEIQTWKSDPSLNNLFTVWLTDSTGWTGASDTATSKMVQKCCDNMSCLILWLLLCDKLTWPLAREGNVNIENLQRRWSENDDESDGGVRVESFQDSGDDGKIGSDSHACLGPYSTQKQYFCKLKQYNNAIHQSVFLHKYIPEHNSRYSYRSLQFNIMCCRISTDIRRWQRARVYVLYGDWCTCGMY